MKSFFLYVLTFPNGKFYYGISGNVARRLVAHRGAARKGSPLYVHCAIRKYGAENVTCTTLAAGPRDYIADLEIKAISAYRTCDRGIGYNLSPGGDVSPMHVEESRLKMTASMLKRYQDPAARKQNSDAQKIAQMRPEVREAKATKRRGVALSLETRAKMSASGKGKKQSPEHIANRSGTQVGVKRSKEARDRMSEGQKKRVRTPEELSRMALIARNRVMTPEHRENLRAAALARWARKRGVIPE